MSIHGWKFERKKEKWIVQKDQVKKNGLEQKQKKRKKKMKKKKKKKEKN